MSICPPAELSRVIPDAARPPCLDRILERERLRQEIRALPPQERSRRLKGQDAIDAFGARACADMRRSLHHRRRQITEHACSDAFIDAWDTEGRTPPGTAFRNERLVCTSDPHRHAVRVRLGRARVRIGNGPATRRFTPPQALVTEDYLDSLSPNEALWYQHPPSPSAVAISFICFYGTPKIRRRRKNKVKPVKEHPQ